MAHLGMRGDTAAGSSRQDGDAANAIVIGAAKQRQSRHRQIPPSTTTLNREFGDSVAIPRSRLMFPTEPLFAAVRTMGKVRAMSDSRPPAELFSRVVGWSPDRPTRVTEGFPHRGGDLRSDVWTGQETRPQHVGRRLNVIAVLACCLGGCQTLEFNPSDIDLPVTFAEAEPDSAPTLDPARVEELRKLLDQPAWLVDMAWSVVAVGQREPSRAWRYLFLPNAAAPSPTPQAMADDSYWRGLWNGTGAGFDERERKAIAALLDSWHDEGETVGANATILLARWNSSDGRAPSATVLQTLEDLAEGDETQHVATRCAAAEAWCRGLLELCTGRSCSDDAEDVLHPPGWLLERPGIPDELRATLWRSLAVRVPPDQLPGLSRTLTDRRQQLLRRAAMEACVLHASWSNLNQNDRSAWPESLASVKLDPDPILRQLFARWAAVSRQDEAVNWLRGLCRDVDLAVQEQAVHCLGRVQTDPARDVLRQMCRDETERRRAMAVAALANWGIDEIQPYAADASPVVRAAVAHALAEHPGDAAQRLLKSGLSDNSLEVQEATVSAVASWPAEFAVPVLLEGVRSGALRTRQHAQDALRSAVNQDVSFPLDAALAEREQAVWAWATTHGWMTEPITTATVAAPAETDSTQHADQLTVWLLAYFNAAAQSLPTADARDQIRALAQPTDVPLIERMLSQHASPAADAIVRELLPALSPLYVQLTQLGEKDIHARRNAARQLSRLAADHPLSPVLLSRLRERLSLEQDQLVWQDCISAVKRESHPEVAQIALLALHSTWPDVRRLGVEYVAQHPSSDSAVWLLPLLHDPQRSVRLAAVAAAARCGHPMVVDGFPTSRDSAAQPGLRGLLTDPDPDLRAAALVAMAAYRDEQACQELIRQTFDPQAAVREQAARAMGQSGQPRFIEPLLKLLWTEPADAVKLAILSSLEVLVPVENQPVPAAGLAASPSIDDKIRTWTAWWAAARDTGRRPF